MSASYEERFVPVDDVSLRVAGRPDGAGHQVPHPHPAEVTEPALEWFAAR